MICHTCLYLGGECDMSCYQGVQDKLQAVARDWFLSDFVRLSQVEMENRA